MRNHVYNPSITVIMETIGGHQDTMPRAIRSFIAQEYQSAKLLILNYHPTQMQLQNVPIGARIEVRNLEDIHIRHVYQHIANLKHVETDCWTILDDDDWLEPDHLTKLVAAWNANGNRCDKPLQVCGKKYQAHYETEEKVVDCWGWGTSLFERLTPAEIDYVYKLFPADLMRGSDSWIAYNSYFDKREFNPGTPTYHWERRGGNHISAHETIKADSPQGTFWYSMNFWRIKLEARAAELKPIDLTGPASTESDIFPLDNAAAFVMAHEEDDYLERVLRWLSSRVGTVFVVQGEKTFSGSEEKDSSVAGVVSRLQKSGLSNIEHHAVGYKGSDDPAANETSMRNEAMELIQSRGYKWVWVVDSDEFYTDQEAIALWRHFLHSANCDTEVTAAQCSMYTYWRSLHWRVDPPEPLTPNIILRSDQRFSRIRAVAGGGKIVKIPSAVCRMRHYSWAKPSTAVERKLKGWGHAKELVPDWYESVFKKWTPGCGMENLHPTHPYAYKKIVACDLPIPESLHGHKYFGINMIVSDL